MSSVYKKIFYDLVRIRMIEEEVARVYPEQEMRCPIHLSVGQEATPVGAFAHLKLEDHVVSTHRAHAHYLAKDGSLKALISELYGRIDGCTKGQGGSMHLIDLSKNFIGSTSIVGGTIPVGVGSAFTAKLKKEKRISVICIGDTAIEEGVFHESMNYASLKQLPVLFLCENNNYSCYSPLKNRQPVRPITEVAKAHGMKYIEVDGNDAYDVYAKMGAVIEDIRNGNGPYFVEAKTFRFLEHCGPYNDDNLNYRDPEEIKIGHEMDTIKLARNYLIAHSLYSKEWEDEITAEIKKEISEAFIFAKNSPYPEISELGAYTYATK